jgi:hypothetical protein
VEDISKHRKSLWYHLALSVSFLPPCSSSLHPSILVDRRRSPSASLLLQTYPDSEIFYAVEGLVGRQWSRGFREVVEQWDSSQGINGT